MTEAYLPPLPAEPAASKKPVLGIAALVLGILAVLIFCIGVMISFGYGVAIGLDSPSADPTALIDYSSPLILISIGLMYCGPGLSLLGTGLGIAAVVQKGVSKVAGIIGLVLNALTLLSFCLLLSFGMITQFG